MSIIQQHNKRGQDNLSEGRFKKISQCSCIQDSDLTGVLREGTIGNRRGQKIVSKKRTVKENSSSWRKHLDVDNPVQHVILHVIEKDLDVSSIAEVDKNMLMKILKMFAIDYSSQLCFNNEFTKQSLHYEIDMQCLMELLKKWTGWKTYYDLKRISSKRACDDLCYYLSENLKSMQSFKDDKILEEIYKYCISNDYVINASCSLRNLQKLFSSTPNLSASHRLWGRSIPKFIFNWPCISTQIMLPNFYIIRENINVNEFQMINFKHFQNESYQIENTQLFENIGTDCSETYSTDFIKTFFKQLTNTINSLDEDEIPHERSVELATAITEFTKDIALCTETIDSNKKYYVNLNSYPYIRNFSDLDDKSDGSDSSDSDLSNIKLQQICHPKMCFELKKFNVPYKDVDGSIYFHFDKKFIKKLKRCIFYNCSLCNEMLGSDSRSPQISQHFINYHGLEQDWNCVNCSKSFSTISLSTSRWSHDCNSPTTAESTGREIVDQPSFHPSLNFVDRDSCKNLTTKPAGRKIVKQPSVQPSSNVVGGDSCKNLPTKPVRCYAPKRPQRQVPH